MKKKNVFSLVAIDCTCCILFFFSLVAVDRTCCSQSYVIYSFVKTLKDYSILTAIKTGNELDNDNLKMERLNLRRKG